ncbi:MAG: hypothetical protein NDJ89_10505 [Oligoflexia bacterium]|nr:hypothetical protein [Oligoflexia bacterium]
MKRLIGLSLVLLAAAPSAFAAERLSCKNPKAKLPRNTELYQAVDQAAELHAFYGELDMKKYGAVFNTVLLQACTNRARNFEAFTARFQVRAKSRGSEAKVFSCVTRQKRAIEQYSEYRRQWSRWYNVETTCRPGAAPRASGGYGYGDDDSANGSSGHDRGSPSPDGNTPAEYPDRSNDTGPDSGDDGSGSPRDPEFGDIQF